MAFRSLAPVMLVGLMAAGCALDASHDVRSESASLGGLTISLDASSVSRSPLVAGDVQTATATLRSVTSVSGLIVDTRIYDERDKIVGKKTFEPVAIAANGTVTLRFDYASPASLAPGKYHLSVGVWDTSWRTHLYETRTFFDVVAPGTAAPAPNATSACDYPDWVEYRYYPAGSIVTFQGNLYIAEHANPGYIPTVSTYFWEPYLCTAGPAAPPASAPPAPPAPSPSAPSGNIPANVVGGYFVTWDGRNGVSLRTIADNTSYNLIYVSFATGISAASGTLRLEMPPGASSVADFRSQVAYAGSKGKRVIVSVGGYYDLGGTSSGYRLDSPTKIDQFMASMRDFRNNWGFHGMDWDLEHGERPDVAGIVDASRRMKAEFGSSFIIAAAPGVNLSTWVGAGGILDQLGPNGWDLIGEQIYDWGIAESAYRTLIVDRMTALSNKYGASKVLLGNKYKTDAVGSSTLSDPQNVCVDIATTKSALATLRSRGIDIRGSFVWNVQSDGDAGYLWQSANGVGGDILAH